MKAKLEAKGWFMYYECTLRCGHKQFYNHVQFKGFEVVVKDNIFTIRLNNQVIAGPFHGFQLDEKLKQFVKV